MRAVANQIGRWLRGFLPAAIGVGWNERLRACSGALLGIALTGFATHAIMGPVSVLPVLIAPIGASSVLLFAVPSSPLAQPWSIIGGNIVAALIGVFFAQMIDTPVLAAAVAVAGTIGAMFALRCLHPPSGAVALTAVLGGPPIHALGYGYALAPVALNSLLLLAVALLFNNATRRPYPHLSIAHDRMHQTTDPRPTDRVGFTPADLDAVLQQYNEVIDVSRDDLETLFLQTEMHAYRRRFGELRCADIMSRDVIAVEFGTDLEETWSLLHARKIGAVPVIDRARRVIGVVTMSDFLRHANLGMHDTLKTKLRALLRRTPEMHSEKPEVAGQIMSAPVVTAHESLHVVELVPLMSNSELHHIPVVDENRRLSGIVTHSDLIAALYHGRLEGTA